jgi:hypothetical protein
MLLPFYLLAPLKVWAANFFHYDNLYLQQVSSHAENPTTTVANTEKVPKVRTANSAHRQNELATPSGE